MTDLSFRAGPFQVCDNGYKLDFKLKMKVSQLCPTLCNPIDYTVHGNSPGQNTGVGCHALLQGIFPTERLNPGLPHCRSIFHQLSHQGSPRIQEWVAYLSPVDLPNPGIKPASPALPADSLSAELSWNSRFRTIAGIIIIEFASILLCRCVLSGLQHALLLTFSTSATQVFHVLIIDSDASAPQGVV